ncbi:large conductance mechanosensitive channel protein MscL [Nocardia shimofusensis]|uniref:large conductance mechanosensitive channel protein MscL n=1 Tax=Nocardia shimofusensis TaxID=228596 RepID=UPI0008359E7B|nr:large conductance mechanosensitive channel protein MscL [Nocardia shimofusensis]
MLKGFKDFLLRGNVVDLAVAVVIGTAFVAIVTAFSDGIINPLLAVFGDANEVGLGFRLVADNPATFVAIGPIITALINFILIAAILYFVLVLPSIHQKKRRGGDAEEPLSDSELLVQIRDLLAQAQQSAGGRHEF